MLAVAGEEHGCNGGLNVNFRSGGIHIEGKVPVLAKLFH